MKEIAEIQAKVSSGQAVTEPQKARLLEEGRLKQEIQTLETEIARMRV